MTIPSEFEILSTAHHAVQAMLNAERDPTRRDALDQVREILMARAHVAKRLQGPPLVFYLPMPGYVVLGTEGKEQTYPHPGHPGLGDAWSIFTHGLTASNTLHAVDLVGVVKRPGNALRNRLATAADWVERDTNCWELAQAMRRPSISISDDGRIVVAARPQINLYGF